MDCQNAEIDTKEGKFTKRGDFSKVERAIEQYRKRGITALYLMGVLERDNNPIFNKAMNEYQFKKPDATPLAITCRTVANNMLGADGVVVAATGLLKNEKRFFCPVGKAWVLGGIAATIRRVEVKVTSSKRRAFT